jgi:transcriptional regulator with XRE-family HTH domain
MDSFGKVVRQLREDAGISLRKFALLLEMSPAYLSKLERDILPPPSEEYICTMADVLETDKDCLLAKAGKVHPDIIKKIVESPGIANKIRLGNYADRRV